MTDPDQSDLSKRLKPSRVISFVLLALIFLLVAVAAYKLSEQRELRHLRVEASHQLDLLASAIDSEVTRHATTPSAVELSPDVLALLRSPDDGKDVLQLAANQFLQKLNDRLGGVEIFVLDVQGRVIASSDWIFTDNLLNMDLSHLQIFRGAISGSPERHFSTGPIRKEPGYFFAQPIRDETQDWRVIGVAVVKSGIRDLERRWLAQERPTLIVDANGAVLLASAPEWRYAQVKILSGAASEAVSSHQESDKPVGESTLVISIDAAQEGVVVKLEPEPGKSHNKKSYLALGRNLPGTAWRIVVFSDLRPVVVQATTHAALASVALACLLLLLLYSNQRRRLARGREEARNLLEKANHELERNVAERTADLSEAVVRLEKEVAERQRAEQASRAAQDELVQAAKLAVLGQMATGITHELSQPLGAIRTLSANAVEFMNRGDLATAEKNLDIVGQLSEQMGSIITPLKTFARKSPAVSAAVDVAQAVDSALFLFEQRLRKMNATVHRQIEPNSWIAWCDQNRLQQVLVNLIGNAIDAMEDQPRREISFRAEMQADGRLALLVSDTGSGFSPTALAHLFEPFFTTKQPGEGLGLGLTISRDILRDFGGDLLAESTPEGGAQFVVLLPLSTALKEAP